MSQDTRRSILKPDVALADLRNAGGCAMATWQGVSTDCTPGAMIVVAGQRLCPYHRKQLDDVVAGRDTRSLRDRLDPIGAARRAEKQRALELAWAEVEAYAEDVKWRKRRADRDRWRAKVQAAGGSRAVLTAAQYRSKLDAHNAQRKARRRGEAPARPAPMPYTEKRARMCQRKRAAGARPYTATRREAPCPMPGCTEMMTWATKKPTRCDACWAKLENRRTA